MNRVYYVYVLFRPWDGSPCYVGKGKGARWLAHEERGGNPRRNKHLANIIKKAKRLGLEIPKIKVRQYLTETEAFETEIALIAAIGRGKGLLVNITIGGDGASTRFGPQSPESRAKKSAAMKTKWADPEFRTRQLAKANDAERRAKQSISMKARWADPEFRSNQKQNRKPSPTQFKPGHQLSHEALLNLSKSRSASWTEERRLKARAIMIGNKYGQGVKPSAETRTKKAKKLKNIWADPHQRATRIASMNAAITPELIAGKSEKMKQLWTDPQYRVNQKLGSEIARSKRPEPLYKRKPWVALGISQSAWYRRRKNGKQL